MTEPTAGSRKWAFRQLPAHTDARGSLVAVESERDVPFPIKRVYYLYGTPNDSERGFHAHRQLQQLAIAVSGSCTFILDDGTSREEVRVNNPATGLFIGAMVWREMRDFSPNSVMLLLASELFDEGDYIRDYAEFTRQLESIRNR